MSQTTTEPKEYMDWQEHRKLLLGMPPAAAGKRGCAGFALLTDLGQECWPETATGVFLPNSVCTWATLVDVPAGHMHPGREAHWASLRKSAVHYGMPLLRGEDAGWDLRGSPKGGLLRPENLRYLRVFNTLDWQMTAFAFCRPALAGKRPDNLPAPPAANPSEWMPEPYLGFALPMRNKLFDMATQSSMLGSASYPEAVQEAFSATAAEPYLAPFSGKVAGVHKVTVCGLGCAKLMLYGDSGQRFSVIVSRRARVWVVDGSAFKMGDPICQEEFDLPEEWLDTPLPERWQSYKNQLAGELECQLRLWFGKQMLVLTDGFVHLPARLAAKAALWSLDRMLYWDVGRSAPYYVEDDEAYVFPPLHLEQWFHFKGSLPYGVRYDLTPQTDKYRDRRAVKAAQRVRKKLRKEKRAKGQ